MLHQRFVYDKKEAVNLNKFQIATRNNILAKIEFNIYQMEETQCICGNGTGAHTQLLLSFFAR